MSDPVGVVLLGRTDRARHREALAAVRGVRVLQLDSPDQRLEEVIALDEVELVSVLSAPAERAYWVQHALQLGRAVWSAAPPATSRREGEGIQAASDAARQRALLVDAPSLHSGFAAAVRRCAGSVGAPLYARLRILVPRTWLAGRTEGVLDAHALWAPLLLESLFGPIDSLAAHTRALARNRPTEDLALAHLDFASGLEAVLEVHALGEESDAVAEFELFGSTSRAGVRDDLHRARIVGLRRQYARLRDHLRGRDASETDLLSARLGRALRLVGWLRQSARLGQRLFHRDV